jgi:hypothetical protein
MYVHQRRAAENTLAAQRATVATLHQRVTDQDLAMADERLRLKTSQDNLSLLQQDARPVAGCPAAVQAWLARVQAQDETGALRASQAAEVACGAKTP